MIENKDMIENIKCENCIKIDENKKLVRILFLKV